MAESPIDPERHHALQELQSYLSDQIAPLMVFDSIELLVGLPPSVAAGAIQAWAAGQYRGGGQGASISDYFFHALRKIQMLSQLKLIEGEHLLKYLGSLGQILDHYCPPGERAAFGEMLRSLANSETEVAPAIELEHMQVGGAGRGGAAAARGANGVQSGVPDEEVQRGLRRFTLMLGRLERGIPGGESKDHVAGRQDELVTQMLTTAALSSRSGADLEQYMQTLSGMGIDSRTDQIFRALGRSLPGWVLPAGVAGEESTHPAIASRSGEAMRQLVAIAESPAEALARYTEMVAAAVHQFNEGHLAQAGAIFDIARRLIAEKKVDAKGAALVGGRAEDSLSAEHLKGFAKKPEMHALLSRVLNFFPAYSVTKLLADLDGEKSRERRQLLLSLLEAHGVAARAAAFDQIEACLATGDPDSSGYFMRNLVSLLRRIPRPDDVSPDKEASVLATLMKWGSPPLVIKEAIGALRQVRSPKAEAAMRARFSEYESLLLKGNLAAEEVGELQLLLDRCTFVLAHLGTANAWRTVVNHALSRQAAFGDTMARLAEIAGQDLSPDKDLSKLLMDTLRQELPRKMLGIVVQKKSSHLLHLVGAISSTRTAEVKALLEEIVAKYSGQEFAVAAGKALAGLAAPSPSAEPPAMVLAGDLDLFGLPALVQTVADARMTGLLTMTDRAGKPMGAVRFEAGKIRDSQVGALSGPEAFYQLFEKPIAATFQFKSKRVGADDGKGGTSESGTLLEVLPEMLEAMRRHDEFQQASALVPDGACFTPAGIKPTAPSGGEDTPFLQAVWKQASSGASPEVCEALVPADSYRIRRLYAHWIEQGALQLK